MPKSSAAPESLLAALPAELSHGLFAKAHNPSSGMSLGDALRLPKRHPACRRREAQSGSGTERENLAGDGKGKDAMGRRRESLHSSALIRTDGAPHAEVERSKPIPCPSQAGWHADRRHRDESVELARCR
jgi:hypothetical protein